MTRVGPPPPGSWSMWAEDRFDPISPFDRDDDEGRNMFRCRRCDMTVWSYRKHASNVHGDAGIEPWTIVTAPSSVAEGWDTDHEGRAVKIGRVSE